MVVAQAGSDAARGVGIAQAFSKPMGWTLPLHSRGNAGSNFVDRVVTNGERLMY